MDWLEEIKHREVGIEEQKEKKEDKKNTKYKKEELWDKNVKLNTPEKIEEEIKNCIESLKLADELESFGEDTSEVKSFLNARLEVLKSMQKNEKNNRDDNER